ncbi:MAG: ornithine carbamoyltransferase [Nitrospiria bacterium]
MPERDLLALRSLSPDDVRRLIDRAKARLPSRALAGKAVGLFFEKASTRTRVSFEVAIAQLGGHPVFLPAQEIQLGRGETVADTARVLSRYLDALVIRTFGQDRLEEWARHATIPIINGLTDSHHPCQILADLMTIDEKKGRLAGLVVAYVGDGNNVAHSLLEGCAMMGMTCRIAAPAGYQPDAAIVKWADVQAAKTGGGIQVGEDPHAAARGADVLYTDVWTSMGQEGETTKRAKVFARYQINADLLRMAKPNAIVMHCLPAHRGEEITGEVMEGPQSVIFDQAENRLHVQKAILELLVGNDAS